MIMRQTFTVAPAASISHPHPGRHLHTFVPLPSSSAIPSLVSHGGIPTHMVINPEPNLTLVDPQRSVSN